MEQINNCGNCKHWDKGDYKDISWNCHKEGAKLGWCCGADANGAPSNEFGPFAVAVCDGEGIYGSLITQDNFCCKSHEPK